LGEYGMLIIRYKRFDYEKYVHYQEIRDGVIGIK